MISPVVKASFILIAQKGGSVRGGRMPRSYELKAILKKGAMVTSTRIACSQTRTNTFLLLLKCIITSSQNIAKCQAIVLASIWAFWPQTKSKTEDKISSLFTGIWEFPVTKRDTCNEQNLPMTAPQICILLSLAARFTLTLFFTVDWLLLQITACWKQVTHTFSTWPEFYVMYIFSIFFQTEEKKNNSLFYLQMKYLNNWISFALEVKCQWWHIMSDQCPPLCWVLFTSRMICCLHNLTSVADSGTTFRYNNPNTTSFSMCNTLGNTH